MGHHIAPNRHLVCLPRGVSFAERFHDAATLEEFVEVVLAEPFPEIASHEPADTIAHEDNAASHRGIGDAERTMQRP